MSVTAKPHTGTCNCHAGTRRASSHSRNRHTPAFARRCRLRQSTLLIHRFDQGGGKRRVWHRVFLALDQRILKVREFRLAGTSGSNRRAQHEYTWPSCDSFRCLFVGRGVGLFRLPTAQTGWEKIDQRPLRAITAAGSGGAFAGEL